MEDYKLYNTIVQLKSLKPSKETNEAFSSLVEFCERNHPISLKSNEVERLRDLCSIAEYEMELYWSKKICDSKNPYKDLEAFWYYKNYEQLVELEYSNSACLYKNIKNVIFVGGGPLPLTAIMLYKKYNIACSILERDKTSYLRSLALVEKLGLSNGVKIINKDAKDYTGYNAFDIIYVAAMVGQDENTKAAVISLIHAQLEVGKIMVCRSSHGTRKLLYTPITREHLSGLNPVLEVRPYNSIINSFFILQKT
jgi:nicotianamine synthase